MIAVGVAALGALVPPAGALGHGSAVAYVNGLHHALLVAAGVAAAGAVITLRVIGARRSSPRQPRVLTTIKPATETA